jgi:hypothetical protein
MWRFDRRASATLALIGLASLAAITWSDARGENAHERYEHQPPRGQRQIPRREAEARQNHIAHPARQQIHVATHPQAEHSRAPQVASDHHQLVSRSIRERQLADGSVMRDTHLAGGGRVREFSRGPLGSQVHVVRFGNALSGTVERTIRPGLVSRTFVGGGHILYTRAYQAQVWHQFGRSFAYETYVPAVRYPATYYAWALAPWPHPVTYAWGWQAQPWYPRYGVLLTPYPVYTSPDLWMTDYILAQSMQTAYQAQLAPPAPGPLTAGASAAPPADAGFAAPPADPAVAAPTPQPGDATPAAAPADSAPDDSAPYDAPPAPRPNATPSATVALPPPVTPQVKAQLNAQIKVQLQEQQAAAAVPAVLTTQTTPPALRSNHVFFQVVQPLEVPSGAGNRYCSLTPNDYIKRVGGMSSDDWMIPVVVELSGPSDCPKGLRTRIGLNDLNAMENEQEAQVMEAMRAASKSMGPDGPPSGPGAYPTLIAAGNVGPDPGALDAIRQAQ